jgi:hypothetical protein
MLEVLRDYLGSEYVRLLNEKGSTIVRPVNRGVLYGV